MYAPFVTALFPKPRSTQATSQRNTCRPTVWVGEQSCSRASSATIFLERTSTRTPERGETILVARRGQIEKKLKVLFHYAGRKISARLVASTSGTFLKVVPKAIHPAVITELQSTGIPSEMPLTIEFSGDRFRELNANMSWFRSGFLAVVAAFGYAWSFDPAYQIVRRQLQNPGTTIIPCFTINTPWDVPWWPWHLALMSDPSAIGVLFGKYLLLYPRLGDVSLYERLDADSKKPGPPRTLQLVPYEWKSPDPIFGCGVTNSQTPEDTRTEITDAS